MNDKTRIIFIPPDEVASIRAAGEEFSRAASAAIAEIMEALGEIFRIHPPDGRALNEFDTLADVLAALGAAEPGEKVKTPPARKNPPVRPVRAVRAVPPSYRIVVKKTPRARSHTGRRRNRRRP